MDVSDLFNFLSARGGRRRSLRCQERGGLVKIPGGGLPGRGGGLGSGGCLRGIGGTGVGANISLGGRNSHQEKGSSQNL